MPQSMTSHGIAPYVSKRRQRTTCIPGSESVFHQQTRALSAVRIVEKIGTVRTWQTEQDEARSAEHPSSAIVLA